MDVTLVMFRSDGTRKEFSLAKERTKIGRTRGCDLRVPLSSVSREHCEIVVERVCASIRDLDSSNGTFLNRRPIDEAMLEAGDEIAIGPVIFTVVIDGQPVRIDPNPVTLGRQAVRRDRPEGPTLTMNEHDHALVEGQEEAYSPSVDFGEVNFEHGDQVTRTFSQHPYHSASQTPNLLDAVSDSSDPDDSQLESQRSGIHRPEPV